jgi:DNA polymerase-3 subunit beta
MKFKADKNKLSEAIITASKACAPRTAVSALDGVLLSLSGNRLTITGYNLETGIRITIDTEGVADGAIVADARLLSDMVRKMPGDRPVEVDVKYEKDIEVKSGKIKLNFSGVSANNFPNIIELNDTVNFKMSENLLKNMLAQIYHAISQNTSNPALTGAKFCMENDCLYIVASDGFRLALRKENVNYSGIEFIVPEKTILELTRNLIENTENDGEVTVVVDRNQISFSKLDYMIFSRIIEGKFVDFKRITNTPHTREAEVNVREFSDSLERTLLLGSEKIKPNVILKLDPKDNTMKINCTTSVGSISEDIDIKMKVITENFKPEEITGAEETFRTAFNPRFMLDALKNSHCDEVKIELAGEYSPIKIRPLEGDDTIFIVVPVRV